VATQDPQARTQPARRLFFALWPNEAERDVLHAWAQACHAAAGGRMVPRENLHVTLAFLGEVEPARLPQLGAIAAGARAAGFELRLDRLGYWPHNRIVHAGASATPPALSALAGALAAARAQEGFRTETRPYHAHVTLLRDARAAPAGVQIDALRWRVDAFVLAESARIHGRLQYRPLQRWTLPA
jgi:2'-5' RNA ligase